MLRSLLLCVAVLGGVVLQAATFGTRVPVAGGPLDLVLDERRNQLYLVDFNTNSVDVYSIAGRRFLPSIKVGAQPVSGALSPDGKFLYVTNFGGATLSVVDLDLNAVARTIALPARPEGVAVGADGKALITTLGTSPTADTLIRFDPAAGSQNQLFSVILPPPPPTAPPAQPVTGRTYLSFRGRLQPTPDGQFIIGVNTPTGNSTIVFVYEVASGQVLRQRGVPGLSSVLSVSPDGQRFMAGLFLFDTATLNVLAQQNANNAPFPIVGNFNLPQNVGGSVFSPDGAALYSAFNIAPFVLPQAPPNSTTLLLSNPRNLGIRVGLQLPENVLGKMVASSDGSSVYALSDSGFLILPMGSLNAFPIVQPETTTVRLAANQCDRSGATYTLRVNNAGRGALRYTATAAAANTGLTMQPEAAQASPASPGRLRLSMNPATTRRIGSTLTPVLLQSQEAVNIPPVIMVYQNWQNAEAKSTILPVETNLSLAGVNLNNINVANLNPAEGLVDILVDNPRQRVYIANSGKNQIEVFDIRQQIFLDPIEVGQFPRSMAFGTDGRTLFVANSGGEWISMVDLDAGREYDRISFPPLPFSAVVGPTTPRAIAQGIFGLQIFASSAPNALGQPGQLWSSSGRVAIQRPVSNAIGTLNLPMPVSMTSTPGNESVLLLAGNGIAYLYDSLADDYVLARTVMTAPITSYYGNVGAGPEGRYFLANRAILNPALVPIGGFAGGGIVIPTPGGGDGRVPGDGTPLPPGQQPGGGGGGGAAGPATTLRNVPAVAPLNATTYARFSTPPQANPTAQPTGDPQPQVELVDINTEQVRGSTPVSEGPPMTVFGNARANIPARLMAIDNRATNAYLITMSGLSVASLTVGRPVDRITINPRAVVNGATYTNAIAPGGLISIFGQNMADGAAAGSLPLPNVLGGSCVTFNDVAVPLLMTSSTQINAQVPPNLRAGNYTVTVRSGQNGLASNSLTVAVAAAAPGVFADASTGDAALFHADDMRPVTQSDPAHRDEVLVLFATGLPAAAGVTLQPGAPAPASPLATTTKPKVFIGDARYKEAEMIVEWSGFTPGFVGLNQINIRVPGAHINGDRLPVTIEVGNVKSPTNGPVVPVTYVD